MADTLTDQAMEIEDERVESVLHSTHRYRTNNKSGEDDQELDVDVDLADIVSTHALPGLHAHGYTKVRTEGSSHGEHKSSKDIELSGI